MCSNSSNNTRFTVTLRNGVEMPLLGLGTSLRGKASQVDSETFVNSVKHALKVGYRHIDTAKCYNNEHLIGKALKESKVNRKEVFLVTKLYPEDMGYERTLRAFEKSCKQLQVDYLDLYLIHFPGVPPGGRKPQLSVDEARRLRQETWRAFEKLYNDGKCRSIGVSNFEKRHLDELTLFDVFPMVNQCEFHPYFTNKDLLHLCKQLNIQFEACGQFNSDFLKGYSPLGKMNILQECVVLDLAKKYQKTPAQIALRWSIQNNVVTIPGSTNCQRIEENFNIFDFELSEPDMAQICSLNKHLKVSWDPREVA